ncbi:succinic semialdehyde dehydrogenase [Mycolicibacterium aubagnense]|uniref:Succinic semialdehyde dehydrogenase n=1 Tax=Mycolicibacterium aubagnense TaxID=319707 RepID=A0ABM7IKR2_9MYCO|nr:succinic semialdehyde dehydrogenase [Mycolicibacterium aubagnense]TLH65617.1 succinic semialdehyde dehydrogenase [Mycolicibacterium aubagnense]WGI31224.1 succinic semialdehyde dehydrogenase [Mycolicibacterium aubagnense]BBX87377.1 succinic semialdehyde dehydrogenase [Mycolicibacterium aubagnense]
MTLHDDLLATLPVGEDSVSICEPFTGDELARIPQMSKHEIDQAFSRARQAQPEWAARSVADRARTIGRLLDLLYRSREQFYDVLQREGGKARIDAVYDLAEALLACRHHVNTATKLLAPQQHSGPVPCLSQARLVYQPHGVVVVIVPWNFPVALGADDALPALIAGNAVILKADNQTALSLLLMRRFALQVGIPAEVFQVVLGNRESIGAALIDNADYIAFTGSTSAGREIGRRAGERLIGCSLELGGKNPMVILPDADLVRAAAALPRVSFANAGQLCMTTERVFVHTSVIDEFTDLAVKHARKVRLGSGYTFDYDMGSITTRANFDRLCGYIEQAKASGATVLTGGRPRPDIGPQCYEPTILVGATPSARLHTEEVFGPIAAIYPFGTVDEAIALANDTAYGLSASIWTRDIKEGMRLGQRIRAGGVNVNDGYTAAFGAHSAPAGGMKASGIGRRHGAPGLLRFTEAQTIGVQRLIAMDSRFGMPRRIHGELVSRSVRILQFLR